ncbi:hypothetical protein EVAR_85353_1 [Eumeta japonica]|uniref:Uncharacterized protein n=1 Tax=Eumeta variegata TaxID=151549 RepID=A0A4C1WT76_EUMVA|nr:hypothetical protein EVAR_85353_1 [Eumeta japonica]
MEKLKLKARWGAELGTGPGSESKAGSGSKFKARPGLKLTSINAKRRRNSFHFHAGGALSIIYMYKPPTKRKFFFVLYVLNIANSASLGGPRSAIEMWIENKSGIEHENENGPEHGTESGTEI